MSLPAIPRGSYPLNLQFTRTRGDNGVSFVLPVGPKQFLCTLGGYPHLDYAAGLSQIDGKDAPYNESKVPRFQLETGKPYTADAYVDIDERRGEVTVTVKVNGQTIIDRLNVATSRLTANWWNNVDDARKFGLVAEQSDVRFHAVHVKMTSGHADLLRPPANRNQVADAAAWVLASGGKMLIRHDGQFKEVKAGQSLPAEPYEVVAVDLKKARIYDADIWQLANLPTLIAVSLEDTLITDAALERLAELPRLVRLDISNNRLSPAATEALFRANALRELTLRGMSPSAQALQSWSREMPSVRLLR